MMEKLKDFPVKSLGLTAALWLFSLFIHFDFPVKIVSVLALVGAALWINAIQRDFPEAVFSPSLWNFKRSINGILIGIGFSLVLSTYSRIEDGLPAIPSTIGGFVIVAVLIGFAEEVIFRGFVQGAAQQWTLQQLSSWHQFPTPAIRDYCLFFPCNSLTTVR